MAKKKNSKSVIITIIITLIVLAGLTYAGIKYILPNYLQKGADTEFEVYKFAVKIFPLLVGIVLIVIASMIATSRRDEEDEEDKLPPNSYDRQLFEAPSDDPSMDKVKPEGKAPAHVASEVTPEEEKQFVSIFDTPSAEEPAAEEPVVEEAAEEPAVEEPAAPAASVASVPAAPAAPASSDKLVDAIYALVNKLDNMADVITYDEDFDDEDEEEDEYEDEVEETKPESTSAAASSQNSALDEKVDKLCDAVAALASIIGSQAAAAQAAPAAAPAEAPAAEEPVVKDLSIEEPAVEEPAVEKPAVVTKTVEVEVPVEVDKVINDADANDPMQRARIEFDSARDGFYDISYAFTSEPLADVQSKLGEIGDAYEVNGKTMIIVPFLSSEEVEKEFNKLGLSCDVVNIPTGSDEEFETAIGAKLQ